MNEPTRNPDTAAPPLQRGEIIHLDGDSHPHGSTAAAERRMALRGCFDDIGHNALLEHQRLGELSERDVRVEVKEVDLFEPVIVVCVSYRQMGLGFILDPADAQTWLFLDEVSRTNMVHIEASFPDETVEVDLHVPPFDVEHLRSGADGDATNRRACAAVYLQERNALAALLMRSFAPTLTEFGACIVATPEVQALFDRWNRGEPRVFAAPV